MSKIKRNSLLDADKEEIRSIFLKTALRATIYTILWIPVFITRCFLVEFVKQFKPNYGKILDESDSTLEEDYSSIAPANSLKFTFVLDAPISLQTLRQLFTTNVLDAKLTNKKTGNKELRYPELKQYQTDFVGYKFWKDDESFNISNHITEQPYSKKFDSMSKVHQEITNKTFPHKRSPWEITLVQNYKNDKNKALIIYRSHHTMGDTKSLVKMLIECLGQKKVKLPNVQYHKSSILDKIQYYFWLPFYFVWVQVMGHFISRKAEKCPWKWQSKEHPLLNLAISKQISINDIKTIAKRNNITASAVIMAAVAGGVAKSDKRLAKSGIPIQYVLPKKNHPNTLANHNYSEPMDLPTDISSPMTRLEKCNSLFTKAKASKIHVYGGSVGSISLSLFLFPSLTYPS